MRRRIEAFATLVAVGAGAAALAASAHAARVVNGDFERGNLSGWDKVGFPQPTPPGRWLIFDEPFGGSPIRALPRGGPPVPEPPQGRFGAITDQNEVSSQFLSQVVKLKAGRKHRLSFRLAYANRNTGKPRARGVTAGFITPNDFDLDHDNQQFRMDVMRPGAQIRSTDGDDVLKRVYRTEAGDPNRRGWRKVTADLTRFAGQRVRLRFAVAVTEAQLHAGIDAVKIKTRRQG